MKRYLEERIVDDLKKKMVLLTGPRQVGKTYLSKQIAAEYFNRNCYLNFDNSIDASVIMEQGWPGDIDLLILDEIHKMSGWKQYLKGVYDTKPSECALLVTGSSRMDTFRQAGESLAGRYFHYRLWPLSVSELKNTIKPREAFSLLQKYGGFPEPFLSSDETYANRWRSKYFTDLVREDILEFGRLQEIRVMRVLLELLRKRVGSPLSYTSIAEDLQVAPNTVRRYVEILEALHIVFLVRPHHANIARAIQKMPKLYFHDSGYVQGDEGVVVENIAAICLRKHADFRSDISGDKVELCYIRTKEKHEVDFALICKSEPEVLIEVKTSSTKVTSSLKLLGKKLPGVKRVHLVRDLRLEQDKDGILIRNLAEWLADLDATHS
ncbi:MAG: ATP-binding protein [Candidatus Aegiribacteria sp.]|nr:ATP-binding protein [Candidatus Aegiribacteria sp.]